MSFAPSASGHPEPEKAARRQHREVRFKTKTRKKQNKTGSEARSSHGGRGVISRTLLAHISEAGRGKRSSKTSAPERESERERERGEIMLEQERGSMDSIQLFHMGWDT